MIIKLDSSYHNKVIKYLERESEFNLLTIGDIERYGYDNYFLNIWADINKKGEIEGILVKCFEFIIFYAYDRFDVNEFADLISSMDYSEISGKSEAVDKLAYKINLRKSRKVKFCKLEDKELLKEDNVNIKVKKMKFRHLGKVAKLYEAIDEFENTTVDNLRNGLKTGRGYFIEVDKNIVAMAKSTAENKKYAMIVGVGTHPNYRNRGLATKCIVKICSELLDENKTPCLFYDNEKAGAIYHKLGFKKIGNWSIYYK
ncbi:MULTISPECIES: GNAT family N-acetyltransferase [unclassified Romboutsia]|uniref:GNAT family N-acetyltransferase n=1 Tax=unclassified Romboutsia TaxID=2626894 RepID=UPI0008233E76|nr:MULTISPECIES: GNAT family N-acetyltransferase [unclassified Romboutsia]SCH09348.1 Predicted acetyltransferase [uncultured Clostridium sp.]